MFRNRRHILVHKFVVAKRYREQKYRYAHTKYERSHSNERKGQQKRRNKLNKTEEEK